MTTTEYITTEQTHEVDVAAATGGLDLARVEEFAGMISAHQGLANNAALAHIGDRLGLWRALASVPTVTSEELAEQTGLAERYLREWLAAQAAAGYVLYEPSTRRFRFPAEHAAVLADDDSPAALAGGFEMNAAIFAGSDRLAHAFATGEGISYAEQDPRVATAVERFFRPLYQAALVDQWLPAIDGLVDRLRSGVRVLDVGCGLGTATLILARAFPASTFVGIDTDAESVRLAQRAASGVDGVSFHVADGREIAGGPYDVVFFFDALHDMGDPVGALRAAREVLADDGVIMAVEPAATDNIEENLASPLGLGWYAASTAVCVPESLSQPVGAALGAQAGPERLIEVFAEAGLHRTQVAAATMFNLVIEARA